MPFPKGHTTRRKRYLYCRNLYLLREYRWRSRWWKWASFDTTPRRVRMGRKWEILRGPKIKMGLKTSNTYNLRDEPRGFARIDGYGVVDKQPGKPPHVYAGPRPWQPNPAKKFHHNCYAHAEVHRRAVKTRTKRPRDPRNTAFNRRVTGSNFFYWRNQFYSDQDVLSRRPNETDIMNGEPYGPPGWPSPLGYQ